MGAIKPQHAGGKRASHSTAEVPTASTCEQHRSRGGSRVTKQSYPTAIKLSCITTVISWRRLREDGDSLAAEVQTKARKKAPPSVKADRASQPWAVTQRATDKTSETLWHYTYDHQLKRQSTTSIIESTVNKTRDGGTLLHF